MIPVKRIFITSDLKWRRCYNRIWHDGFYSLVPCIGGIFWVLCWRKCRCHFRTMLDMQLHSCSNLAHFHGYNSDNGRFRDCLVSHCVQMCLSYFFSFFVCYFFFVSFSFFLCCISCVYKVVVITMMAYLLLIKWDEFSATLVKKSRENGWLNFQLY